MAWALTGTHGCLFMQAIKITAAISVKNKQSCNCGLLRRRLQDSQLRNQSSPLHCYSFCLGVRQVRPTQGNLYKPKRKDGLMTADVLYLVCMGSRLDSTTVYVCVHMCVCAHACTCMCQDCVNLLAGLHLSLSPPPSTSLSLSVCVSWDCMNPV